MDPSFPIVPTGPGRAVARRTRGLERAQTGAVHLHQAGEMGLGTDEKLRQECWETIGERTRTRLTELAGGVIDWIARRDSSSADGRPYAVVFGDKGLSIAEPRISTEHRPVYSLSAFVFVPASLRHVQVDYRPLPTVMAGPSGPATSGQGNLGLGPEAQGLLGNLPPRVQELLQTPFVSGQPVLRCNWGYEGFEHSLDMFMVCLAGARDVTVATGTKMVPAGHTSATAHWSLTCYRASVARRIGK